MARSAKKPATTKRSSAKSAGTLKSTKITTPSAGTRFSNFFNNLQPKTGSAPRVQRRVWLPVLGLVVLLGLLYLAGRFLVVAWVDKKPVTRWDYYNQLDQKYGHDLREQLIVQSLIDSEAQKHHVSASEGEINNEIKKIEQEQGGAPQLDQVLQSQNLSRKDLHNLVKLQILRQKMFGDNLAVSDDDVNQYISQNKNSLPQTNPGDASAEANLKNNVRQQLLHQKVNASFSAWLQQNLNSDRVIRL